MKACGLVGVKQAFTSYNNPKGNAETERFMRTMKEELVWINEWKSPLVFQQALANWIDEYNHHYLHSALGYLPPVTLSKILSKMWLDKTGAFHHFSMNNFRVCSILFGKSFSHVIPRYVAALVIPTYRYLSNNVGS